MDRWTVDHPQTIALEGVRTVHVRIVAGHVDVIGTDGDARLEVEHIKGQPLEVTLDDGELVVAYEDLSWRSLLSWVGGNRRTVHLSLAVPKSASVEVGVVSASALVSGLTAETAIRSVSGEVTVDGVNAAVTAETVSGNVETQALAGPLDFKTVSGDLTVVDGTSDTLTARAVSGDITIDLDLAPSGEIRVETVSGDVTLRLPESAGAKVDLTSVSGKLSSGFDGLSVDTRPGRKRITGEIGDGSGRLTGDTVSGDIAVLSRAHPPTGMAYERMA